MLFHFAASLSFYMSAFIITGFAEFGMNNWGTSTEEKAADSKKKKKRVTNVKEVVKLNNKRQETAGLFVSWQKKKYCRPSVT